MKKQPPIFYVFIAVFLFSGYIVELRAASGKPNIVIFLADDLGYQDAGYHHLSGEVSTPNIDAIASAGVYFTAGYVTAPVCGPTRNGLLTGLYQHAFGAEHNAGPFRAEPNLRVGIPDSIPTIAEHLKKLGYTTSCIGKWHVGGEEADMFYPTNKGFDEFFGFLGGASEYYNPDKFFRGTERVTETLYTTDAFGREAVDFVERNKDNPFFLYLSFNAVHGPIGAPDSLKQRFSQVTNSNRRTLLAMNYSMDQNIGKVMRKLREHNLEDSTLVFFLSDNGGMPSNNYSYNLPLRGEKGQYFEGGIRIPFCIQWPGHIAPGIVCTKPISALDVLTTSIVAAGGTIDPKYHLEGVDLIPYINNENTGYPHDHLCWRLNNYFAIRDSAFKLMRQGSTFYLFDLENDLSETTNLYANPAFADRRASLEDKFDAWEARMSPALWGWGTEGKPYVMHYEETFDGIYVTTYTANGPGTQTEIVDNPDRSGVNISEKVLKISKSISSGAGAGISARPIHNQFRRRYRYLHMKVYKENISPVRFRLNGDNNETFTSINQQSKIDEWEDMVFDIGQYPYNAKIENLYPMPDYETGRIRTLYIDDIYFNDNPEPETIKKHEIPGKIPATAHSYTKGDIEIDPGACWLKTGGRVNYDINVTHYGIYDVTLRAASNSSGIVNMIIGDDTLQTFTIPATDHCEEMTQVTRSAKIPGSAKSLYLAADSGSVNLDTITFSLAAQLHPPLVSIINPEHEQVFLDTDTIVLKANASDSDGEIVKVEFYEGREKIGEDSDSPYEMEFAYSRTGVFDLSAVAVDDEGFLAKSLVSITVNSLTGSESLGDESFFTIYQNPVNEYLKIETGREIYARLEVYDLSGEMIMSENDRISGIYSLNISKLKSGIYILLIEAEGVTQTCKLLKN